MNGRTDQAVLPQTHQDEFPAEYSLAGCSPAEPASASSATLILNQKPPVQLQNYSERQLSPPVRVSFPHAVQVSNADPLPHTPIPAQTGDKNPGELSFCSDERIWGEGHGAEVAEVRGAEVAEVAEVDSLT